MRLKAGLLALVLCLSSAALAGASELEAVLQRLKSTAGAVTTIQSSFVQEKHLTLFAEVLKSQGRFFFQRPDRLRWEYQQPVAMGFVINGDRGRRWNSLVDKEQPFQLEDSLEMRIAAEQLLVWTRMDLDKLRRSYDMALAAQQPVALRLIPKGTGARQFVDHLQVTFSADARTVTEVVIVETGGDRTRLCFSDTQINGPLSEALFRP